MGFQGDEGLFVVVGQEGEDELEGDVARAQGQVVVEIALVIVQVQVADNGPESFEPALKVPTPDGISVTHIQADLDIGEIDALNGFGDEARVLFIDVFQPHPDAERLGPDSQLPVGGGGTIEPVFLVPTVVPGLITQVADYGNRLEDRQPPPCLAQPPPAGREDIVVQSPRSQILERSMYGETPSGFGKGPGNSPKGPGGIGAETPAVQADLGIEAPVQETLQIAVQQERKRDIDLNPVHQGNRCDAHEPPPPQPSPIGEEGV
jgi:hypothetical protein